MKYTKWPETLHLVTYIDDPNSSHNNAKLKSVRKLHVKAAGEYLRTFFWLVTDPVLARSLGLSTREKDMGNVYALQNVGEDKASGAGIVRVCGCPFSSELVLTNFAATHDPVGAVEKLFGKILSRPLIVDDQFQYLACKLKVGPCV